MAPLCCWRRDHVLGGEDAALEVDRDAAVERFLGDVEQLGIAAGKTDADIVVQDIDAAPAAVGLGDHRLDLGILGDVGFESDRRASLGRDQFDGFLRRWQIVIHAQHPGAFAREGERGGAAVADAFAGGLAGADDDGDAILQAHVSSLPGSGTAAVPLCNRARCRSSWWRVRGPRRNKKRWSARGRSCARC
jgi:hypothetical protein